MRKILLITILTISSFAGGWIARDAVPVNPSQIDTVFVDRPVIVPARTESSFVAEPVKPDKPSKRTFTSPSGVKVYLTADLEPSGLIGQLAVDSVYIPADTVRCRDQIITVTVPEPVPTTDLQTIGISAGVGFIVGMLVLAMVN